MTTIENNVIIFTGKVKSAYHSKKENNGETVIKNVISIYPEDVKEVFESIAPVFKNVGKKFTPEWFKKGEYIILKSLYDIKVRVDCDGKKEMSFNEWLERGLIKGSEIKIKANLKTDESGEYSGVIYPIAFTVSADGEEFNSFEGM